MKSSDIPGLRLYNQHITHPRFSEPHDIVKWLGAVQAQDYLGALWAIGLRLKNSTEAAIEKAVEEKKIVRSWPMRGTLHFVAAEDLRWMLKFLTPRVIRRSAGLYREAGLDTRVFSKSSRLLSAALKSDQQLTRNEIYAIWERAKISTSGQRGLHILGHLAQTGLICFGSRKGKQQTFVLLDEWLPPSKMPQKEEALAALGLTYFQSHGPATIHDFSWWSGLTIAEAKEAVESLGSQLESKRQNHSTHKQNAGIREQGNIGTSVQTYYLVPTTDPQKSSRQVFLLPAYDEYFVAYKDRTAAFNPKIAKDMQKLGNGIFSSPVVLNGLMSGFWKRSFIKDKVLIEANVFSPLMKPASDGIEAAARKFGKFLKTSVEVSQRNV